ncbi:MAG TPA: GAF domain-containing protein [Anaerolineales bacterium]|nr:GAF domain-containing protein [Anaerolineales bacterium]
MNQSSHPQSDFNTINEHLAATFYASGRYNPLLLAVAGLGFLAIFLLTRFGILGEPAPQLLYLGGATLLFAAAQIPVLALAQNKKGVAAFLAGSVIAGIFGVLLTFLWQGMVPIAILIAILWPVSAVRVGLPRKYYPALVALVAALLIGIFYVNGNAPMNRLQNGTPAAIASIVFLIATGLLLLTITLISQNRRFSSLQSLLLTSFVIIVTIPTVMAAVLSAVGAYANSQTQTFNTLEAITTLKVNQMEALLADSQNDTETLLADSRFRENTQELLTATGMTPQIQQSLKRTARSRMVDVLGAEEEAYNEIMVLDTRGNVVVSTIPSREGSSFEKQTLFQKGVKALYAEFADERTFGTENLIVATPIMNTSDKGIEGVLVLRSNAASLKDIMENTPGFTAAETYLVDTHFNAVTRTREPVEIVNSRAALDAIRNRVSGTRSTYPSYNGEQVLGYYQWFAPMQLAVVAEVPLNFVVNSSLQSLAGSALLALFVVAVAITAVVISARTITDPIKTLAETTESFAAGKFSARAVVDREDEIGALAHAYNQMAAQLQEMIGGLEQRVTDRTRDLEEQTLRLRVAAEIARDAASARDLQELLDKTAELISKRFGFYHTGIFLIDNEKEYAVLVASPTEAGRKMIENNHRLRVGEIGIVGRVAATGEPRVTLNTGSDAVYFNNPYLPHTRSEMSLPLKVENNVTGVLDVQSDLPDAFDDDDIAIMQILADQLAIAIERTRLLQEVERSLKELESAYGRFTTENWSSSSAAGGLTGKRGYRFDNIRIEPVTELPQLADSAIKAGTIRSSSGHNPDTGQEHQVAVPIKLRGQTIGVINLKLKEGYDSNTISIVELATERLAAAMESARLYEEARLRADREQAISRVTTAISASTEYEQILQTTVREIGSILGDTEVAIQILEEPVAEKRLDRRES